jgi:hypothetical protein
VHGSVVRGADRDQVARVVTSAVGACFDVMHIYVRCVGATRDLTAMMISPQHTPTHGGRHLLCRSLGLIE